MLSNKVINIILVFSVILNILIFGGAAIFIQKKGGVKYLKQKISSPVPVMPARSTSYQAHREILNVLPKTVGDIIFVGDSITAGMNWTKLFGDIHIRNMGIGMDYSEGVLLRIDDIIRLCPSKVFIMLGIADLNNYYVPIAEIIENYRKIIERITSDVSGTKIYFQSVLPKGRYACTYVQLNKDIVQLNRELSKLCQSYSNVTYVDLYSLFSVPSHELNPEYTYDGGHLNGKGYLVWQHAIERYVAGP